MVGLSLRIRRPSTDRANVDGYLGGCSESRLVVYEGRLVLSIDMKALFANFLALLLLAVAAVGVYAADIAVVISSEANVYQEALEGFREVVRHRIVNVQTLKDNPAGWRDECDECLHSHQWAEVR